MMLLKTIFVFIFSFSLIHCTEQPINPEELQPRPVLERQVNSPKSISNEPSEKGSRPGWTSVYLASWEHNAGTPYTNWGSLTTSEINFSGMTHLIYFAMNVGADGRPGESLDPVDRYNFTSDRFRDIIPVAHAHDVEILFSIGGAGNYNGFSRAISTSRSRTELIRTIIMLIKTYGFDGVDLDMEPIRDSDRLNYQRFVEELSIELDQVVTKRGARPLLTAAVNGQFSLFAQLQDYFDQINLMTYDLSGPWSGWQAWHNSPLYSDGILFESTGEQKPSADLWIDLALNAGIRPEKLGLGIDFYGYVWNGVSEPGEGWFFLTPPTLRDERGGTPYRKLYREFNLRAARWDSVARVPYLSFWSPSQFVSFDNERSIEEKVRYAAERGLGGVMIWELSAGFVQDQLRGNVHPLLQSVHKATTKYRPPLRTQD